MENTIQKELPKVSITIPTYNQERFIVRAIRSALIQDYKNLEIIISDDCSTDKTQEVISEFLVDDRMKYSKNAKNLGRVANYKKTLCDKVTGEWVLNIDGDDYLYDKSSISYMISSIAECENKNVVAVMGSQLNVNTKSGIYNKSPTNYETGLHSGLDIFLNWDKLNFGHLATLYRADLARKIGYYNLDIISSDWESVLRLILHGNVLLTKNVISVWNLHGDNATTTKSMQEWIEDYKYIEEASKYALRLGVDKQSVYDWHRRMIQFHTRAIGNHNCSMHEKIFILFPYILKNYYFSLLELASFRGTMKSLLMINPTFYEKVQTLYFKHRIQKP